MAIKDILQYGDETLNKISEKVKNVEEVRGLIQDLKDTLYNCNGIGLAAPQIGVLKRVILIDLRDGSDAIILINPEIVEKHGKEDDYEGCLSYPGYEGIVQRPKKITIKGMNEKGEMVEYTTDGLLCRAFCHETDHLDGILYMEKAKKMYIIEE